MFDDFDTQVQSDELIWRYLYEIAEEEVRQEDVQEES